MKRAEELAEQGDYPRAIEKLEEAILIDPKDRTVLFLLVKYTQAQSRAVVEEDPAQAYRRMVTAGGYLRMLREAHRDPTEEEKRLTVEVLYNEASAHARSLRVEETIGALREAVAAGFRDLDRVLTDPDWASMRELPQFKKTYDELTKAASSGSTKPADSGPVGSPG